MSELTEERIREIVNEERDKYIREGLVAVRSNWHCSPDTKRPKAKGKIKKG